MRSVAGSSEPIQIGGWGFCTGFGPGGADAELEAATGEVHADVWNVSGAVGRALEAAVVGSQRPDEACAAIGRDPGEIRRAVQVPAGDDPAELADRLRPLTSLKGEARRRAPGLIPSPGVGRALDLGSVTGSPAARALVPVGAVALLAADGPRHGRREHRRDLLSGRARDVVRPRSPQVEQHPYHGHVVRVRSGAGVAGKLARRVP